MFGFNAMGMVAPFMRVREKKKLVASQRRKRYKNMKQIGARIFQQTKKGLRTELSIPAEKDNMFCFLTQGPSLGEKKPKEERSRRKETRKVRVGTQHCWDNLISDQRRKGRE